MSDEVVEEITDLANQFLSLNSQNSHEEYTASDAQCLVQANILAVMKKHNLFTQIGQKTALDQETAR